MTREEFEAKLDEFAEGKHGCMGQIADNVCGCIYSVYLRGFIWRLMKEHADSLPLGW